MRERNCISMDGCMSIKKSHTEDKVDDAVVSSCRLQTDESSNGFNCC